MVEFLDSLDLSDISLVCQDWGGVIGLRMVAEDPTRFVRVFAANGVPARMDTPFLAIPVLTDRSQYPVDPDAELRTWDDFIASAVDLIGEDMSDSFFAWVKFALTVPDFRPSQNVNTGGRIPLTPGEIATYDAPFPPWLEVSMKSETPRPGSPWAVTRVHSSRCSGRTIPWWGLKELKTA